ncbi:MAG TPA: Stp1/IreP family PP2C-type Ser/Thr phosphatase [Thermoanaerobaculia bacterium]|nr:Stp1/IreP family PP2C-type Ser/Thr phosphatase [Thermoanaerobaculia bacterium]
MHVESFGITDVGRQRQHNEDAYLVDDKINLYLVADGMGGHAAGEVASRLAAETISEFIVHTVEDDGTWPHAYDENFSRNTNRLLSALIIANTRVIEAMKRDARLRGMGTTVVAGLFDDTRASIAHVGDSRAYLIRDNQMSRVTSDHSWVFEQVRAGMLTEAEAEKHPLRNVITRALGGANTVAPEAAEIDLRKGDHFLFCSDGLTGMVSEDDILRIVTEHESLDEACHVLVRQANEKGGNDNITAVLIRTS